MKLIESKALIYLNGQLLGVAEEVSFVDPFQPLLPRPRVDKTMELLKRQTINSKVQDQTNESVNNPGL